MTTAQQSPDDDGAWDQVAGISTGQDGKRQGRIPVDNGHLAEDSFRLDDRVAAVAQIELLAARDDRIMITARFARNPNPIVIDSIWTGSAAMDLHLGDHIRLYGRVSNINYAEAPNWDTASVLFDGLHYTVALPLIDVEKVVYQG